MSQPPYLQDQIFGADAEILIQGFLGSTNTLDDLQAPERHSIAREYVEMGVRLGFIVADQEPSYFYEIACGIAIPSFTLLKMGFQGEAFDFIPKDRGIVGELSALLNLPLIYSETDFYEWNPSLKRGDILIADKPRGKDNLESDIVDFAISHGVDLALVPYVDNDLTPDKLRQQCGAYMARLAGKGYEARTIEITEGLERMVHWVINATKSSSS